MNEPAAPSFLTPLRFNTGLVPPDMRFAAWQRALSNFVLSREAEEPFSASAEVWLLNPLLLTHACVDPLRYDRSSAHVARDGNDHFAMVYLLSGTFDGDYGDGVVRSGPNSLTILDLSLPCWTDAVRLEAFILSMPRVFLAPLLGGIEPHGLVATQGCAPLLGAVLKDVVAALPTLMNAHVATMSTMIRDLVVRAILDADWARRSERPREEALIARVRDYIDRHLGDALDSNHIAAVMDVSRSTLYRAFEYYGGVQQQVQRRRLAAMRRALVNEEERRPISEIAAAVGFVDQSHATRLFKRAFGVTPGQYRDVEAAKGVGESPLVTAPDVFNAWASQLD